MDGLLKFITCGSVDDGKSTLIGHILYDAKLLYADQEKALELESKVGSRGGAIDYSLLLDGLMAEREQGITIDVAYRYFSTEKRSFIVADTPGHEEYTRNMAVGASFADLAIILVDAVQGVLVQTRRHARICSLMGIKHFIFALNKMDLAAYSQERFEEVKAQIQTVVDELGLENVKVIPVSATEGDNVTRKSEVMNWYTGETILEHLENVDVSESHAEKGFYMPVQRVCRPNHEFRGFQGQIEAGSVHLGDEIETLPSHEHARVRKIISGFDEVQEAGKGQAVNIQLDREVDVSRGCVFQIDAGIKTASNFTATLLWMDDASLERGKNFYVKLGTKLIPGIVTDIQYAVDVNTGAHNKKDSLGKNEIAVCKISVTEPIVVEPFTNHKTLGELILIDRITNMTSACGVVSSVDSTTSGLFSGNVTPLSRAAQKIQSPIAVEFLLGRNGVNHEFVQKVEKLLATAGRHTYLYAPVAGEDYENVVTHLHEAGLVVLLALDGRIESDGEQRPDGLRSKKWYYHGWQKNLSGLSTSAVAEEVLGRSLPDALDAQDYSI